MAIKKIDRGHYYEDFQVGDLYAHHWGRTINEGDNSLFTTLTMNFNPLYFNAEHAKSLGYQGIVVNNLLVFNVVFGLSVEDLSEKAIANLGYLKLKFHVPVYPGDTLFSESTILDKRESQSRPDRGIVHVKTIGKNQRGEVVLEYERNIMVKKRSHYAEQ
ncbi:MAG: MaoC family dehydratase [Candidatus Tectomicrobia bacterium]|nr:MaoC family dehydratase [Candidatus Tectomicrobia bacterium]